MAFYLESRPIFPQDSMGSRSANEVGQMELCPTFGQKLVRTWKSWVRLYHFGPSVQVNITESKRPASRFYLFSLWIPFVLKQCYAIYMDSF